MGQTISCQWLFLAFFNSEEEVLFPDLTYGFYKVWADLYRIPFREVPLTSSFEIDTQDYLVEKWWDCPY